MLLPPASVHSGLLPSAFPTQRRPDGSPDPLVQTGAELRRLHSVGAPDAAGGHVPPAVPQPVGLRRLAHIHPTPPGREPGKRPQRPGRLRHRRGWVFKQTHHIFVARSYTGSASPSFSSPPPFLPTPPPRPTPLKHPAPPPAPPPPFF